MSIGQAPNSDKCDNFAESGDRELSVFRMKFSGSSMPSSHERRNEISGI
jgi:hypothetical protein